MSYEKEELVSVNIKVAAAICKLGPGDIVSFDSGDQSLCFLVLERLAYSLVISQTIKNHELCSLGHLPSIVKVSFNLDDRCKHGLMTPVGGQSMPASVQNTISVEKGGGEKYLPAYEKFKGLRDKAKPFLETLIVPDRSLGTSEELDALHDFTDQEKAAFLFLKLQTIGLDNPAQIISVLAELMDNPIICIAVLGGSKKNEDDD